MFGARFVMGISSNKIRPVVTINSNTRISGGDGLGPSTAYKIMN